MKLGMFLMPSHPPERGLKAGQEWDLEVIRSADQLGYSECWIGEHFTAPWEPNPAPDLLIAQALMQTKRIKLAPGAHLLPYHHPAELACRVAFMDHLAEGRYMLGIGASGLPSPLGTSTCRRSGLDISDRSVPKSVKAHAARIDLDGANFSAHSQGLDSCCASSTWLR